jgi:hypothetical protein
MSTPKVDCIFVRFFFNADGVFKTMSVSPHSSRCCCCKKKENLWNNKKCNFLLWRRTIFFLMSSVKLDRERLSERILFDPPWARGPFLDPNYFRKGLRVDRGSLFVDHFTLDWQFIEHWHYTMLLWSTPSYFDLLSLCSIIPLIPFLELHKYVDY